MVPFRKSGHIYVFMTLYLCYYGMGRMTHSQVAVYNLYLVAIGFHTLEGVGLLQSLHRETRDICEAGSTIIQ